MTHVGPHVRLVSVAGGRSGEGRPYQDEGVMEIDTTRQEIAREPNR